MSLLRTIKQLIYQLGINPVKGFNSLRSLPYYVKNYFRFSQSLKATGQPFPITSFYPALEDRFDTAGSIPLHYFYLDLHVARRIHTNNPQLHVDIGSRLDGFCAMVASFRKLEIFDIRKLDSRIPNITFRQADFMADEVPCREYCDSISCLHAIEHFGLGRYGDTVDADGHIKGLNNIYTLLKPGGTFYFATPIGPQRVEFDAHRVFSISYLLSLFRDRYTLLSFSYINDANEYFENHTLSQKDIEDNLHCTYGCGIFELRKL